MAKKGAECVRYKRVRGVGRRCADFVGGRRKRR